MLSNNNDLNSLIFLLVGILLFLFINRNRDDFSCSYTSMPDTIRGKSFRSYCGVCEGTSMPTKLQYRCYKDNLKDYVDSQLNISQNCREIIPNSGIYNIYRDSEGVVTCDPL